MSSDFFINFVNGLSYEEVKHVRDACIERITKFHLKDPFKMTLEECTEELDSKRDKSYSYAIQRTTPPENLWQGNFIGPHTLVTTVKSFSATVVLRSLVSSLRNYQTIHEFLAKNPPSKITEIPIVDEGGFLHNSSNLGEYR